MVKHYVQTVEWYKKMTITKKIGFIQSPLHHVSHSAIAATIAATAAATSAALQLPIWAMFIGLAHILNQLINLNSG